MSRKKATVQENKTPLHPFLWKWVTQEDLTKLDQMTPEQVEKSIADLMNLENYKTDLRDGGLVDYYVSHYWWASKIKRFTFEQTSIYFGIAHVLLDNLKEKNVSLVDNASEFKNIISQINQNVRLFNNNQIIEITDSIYTSLFQHYKMYEFLFHNMQDDYVVLKEIEVEAPVSPDLPYPPPLDEALPEHIYNKYILKISDEPEVKPVEEEATVEQQETQIEIPAEVENQIKSMFDGLTLEDAKNVIYEVTNDIISDLKIDMRKILKDREAALINEVTKVASKTTK